MKTKRLFCASIICMSALLASCVSTVPSSTVPPDPTSTVPSSTEPVQTEWNEELKAMMISYIGEVLPYIEIPGTVEYYSPEETGGYLAIEQLSGTVDLSEQYKPALLAAGYTLEGVSDELYGVDTYTYTKSVALGTIIVETLLVPADPEGGWDSGFCIWVELNVPVSYLTSWDSDFESVMMTYVGEVLPFSPETFSDSTEIDVYEGMPYLFDGLGTEETIAKYAACLVANGFSEVEGEYNPVYIKDAKEEGHELVVDPYLGLLGGVYVDFYVQMKPIATASWPGAEILAFLNVESSDIPAFTGSDLTMSYVFSETSFVVTIEGVASDALEAYADALMENDYYAVHQPESDYYYEYVNAYNWLEDTHVFATSEKVGVMLVSIEKNEAEYEEIVEDFPSAKIAALLPEGSASVPTFAATAKGYKVFPATEGVLQIEVLDPNYTNENKLEVTYAATLASAGYTVSSERDENGFFVATSSDETVDVYFYNVGCCFEVAITEHVEVASILPTDVFSGSYKDANDNSPFTSASGLTFNTVDVINQSGNIQLKKSSGKIYNTTAYEPIVSITIVGGTGTFTVEAGESPESLSVITGVDGVYDLAGATYFVIKNASSSVATCSEIIFAF